MKVAVVQHDIVWEDAALTQARLAPLIEQAAAGRPRLIVLSEMFATGFSMRPERVAEEPGGPTERFLLEQAARHDAWLVGSIAQWSEPETGPAERERPAGEIGQDVDGVVGRKAANVAVLAGPNGELHRYAKIHPFSYAGEDRYYTAGTRLLTVSVDDVRVSVFVCYDLRFADEFWQLAADTDLYVVVANWPAKRRAHWQILLRARAVENQAYVVGCNRIGSADGADYCGDSAIIDPLGATLAEASQVETVLCAEVDPAEVKRVRDRFPFLADRR